MSVRVLSQHCFRGARRHAARLRQDSELLRQRLEIAQFRHLLQYGPVLASPEFPPPVPARPSLENGGLVTVEVQTDPLDFPLAAARKTSVLKRGRSGTPTRSSTKTVRLSSGERQLRGEATELDTYRAQVEELKRERAAHAAMEARRTELQRTDRVQGSLSLPSGASKKFLPLKELFLKHVGNATSAQLTEPYLVSSWQLGNLKILIEAMLEGSRVRQMLLKTHVRSLPSMAVLKEMHEELLCRDFQLEYTFKEELHLRELALSNGVTVMSDRGLDVYRAPGVDGIRYCRPGLVLYFETLQPLRPPAAPLVAEPTKQPDVPLEAEPPDLLFLVDPWRSAVQQQAQPRKPQRSPVIQKRGYVETLFGNKGFGFVGSDDPADGIQQWYFSTYEAPPEVHLGVAVTFTVTEDGRCRQRAVHLREAPAAQPAVGLEYAAEPFGPTETCFKPCPAGLPAASPGAAPSRLPVPVSAKADSGRRPRGDAVAGIGTEGHMEISATPLTVPAASSGFTFARMPVPVPNCPGARAEECKAGVGVRINEAHPHSRLRGRTAVVKKDAILDNGFCPVTLAPTRCEDSPISATMVQAAANNTYVRHLEVVEVVPPHPDVPA